MVDKKYPVLVLIAVIVIAFAIFLFYKPIGVISFEKTNCFDYYAFGSKFFTSASTEKESYAAGKDVTFYYTLKNLHTFPLSNGAVRVQIFYRGSTDVDRPQGDDMIDEFYLVEGLRLKSGDEYSSSYVWNIPINLKEGIYVANFYLVDDYKYNLAGLSFLPNIPGSSTIFIVNSTKSDTFLFDRTKTFVNDVLYNFRSSPPSFNPDDEIAIRTNLINAGSSKNVEISYQVYKEDSLDSDNIIDSLSKTETIQLKENSTTEINYVVNILEPGPNLIVIKATDGKQTSILKIFIPIIGDKGRIIYSSLIKFPLQKGDASGFICMTNAGTPPNTNTTIDGKVSVLLTDSSGNTIAKGGKEISLDALVSGYKFSFISPDSYRSLNMVSTFIGSDGVIQDQVTANYDYSKFMNIEANLDVRLKSDSVKSGDNLQFLISYKDEYDDPIEGKFVEYILDSSGKVILAIPEKIIDGLSAEEIKIASGLPSGTYTLKVVEKIHEKTSSLSFSVE